MPRRNHHPSMSSGGSLPHNRGGLSGLASTASDAVATAGERADELAASVGSGMRSVADDLRGAAPRQQSLQRAAHIAADTLERTGRYLQEEGVSGLAADVVTLIRRNPVPIVVGAIGLGFLVACSLRRS